MKKIAVVTSTRAEFGLLMPVVKELRKFETEDFLVDLIVTGTHLIDSYGKTIDEIIANKIRIDEVISIHVKSESVIDISRNQAETLVKFSKLFSEKEYGGVVLLGDRYESLVIAIAAGNTHTPVFHLCGGDTTEGAIDEWIRHSISKIAYMHFPTNEVSQMRLIQLGEEPERIFNFGSTSIDNIKNLPDMSKDTVLSSVELNDCRFAVCTYHPVTMGNENVIYQIEEFLNAVRAFPTIQFIVTKSNADVGGAKINNLLDLANREIENVHVYTSLGAQRYLSLIKYSEFVLGNSSSGIIEAPAFGVPTVNIGDRQRGRLQSASIINCGESSEEIVLAIRKAINPEFRHECKTVVSPYGNGHAAENIAKKIHEVVSIGNIDLRKKFFNIEVKQ